MMEFNFTQPTRQSYVAILLIIQRFYKTMIRQLWPLLLVFFLGGGFSEKKEFIIAIGIVGVFVMIYGIISFFKYLFYVNDSELVVEKGVLKRTKTTIPFDRIQSIDFEQNIIHRIFNVVKLKIDTAGSSGKELNLHALDLERAKAFRQLIFDNQSELAQQPSEVSDLSFPSQLSHGQQMSQVPIKEERILKIDIPELLKIGISANHFRSAAVIIFFLLWIYENLEDIGMDPESYLEELPNNSAIMQSVSLLIFLIITFTLIALIISLVRTVLQYFDLSFIRQEGKFKVVSGLLNRKETAAIDKKIQVVNWSQNVLQKWMDLYELRLRQASSAEAKLKSAIQIPGIRIEQIEKVKQYLFKDIELPFLHKFKVQRSYFFRYALYALVFGGAVFGLLFFVESYKLLILFVVIWIYQIIALYLRSKKYAISYNERHLKLNEGSFGNKTSLIALHKIQNIQLKQSIYQRRNSLADILIQTAGGKVSIPYLRLDEARMICDFCLYKVESSEEDWM